MCSRLRHQAKGIRKAGLRRIRFIRRSARDHLTRGWCLLLEEKFRRTYQIYSR